MIFTFTTPFFILASIAPLALDFECLCLSLALNSLLFSFDGLAGWRLKGKVCVKIEIVIIITSLLL